jgi:hypothetical protein
VRSSSLLIDYQCPQCGAPAVIEETDHLFTCDFCRVKSYLLSRVYRYVMPHKAPEDRDLIYLPYWRFKGMLFSCTDKGVAYRIVDVSHRGVETAHAPLSLGLRSQTQRLRFLSPDTAGRFLIPDVSYAAMLERIKERFNRTGSSPLFLQSFIGETLSIIYAPFYLEGRLYDALLNRPVSPPLHDRKEFIERPGGRPAWELRFVPAQCPRCGWDLEGERDSFALSCQNCLSIWHAGKRRFMKLEFGCLADGGGGAPATLLPFFRVRSKVTGVDLDSLADLVRLGNLPRAVKESMEQEPFYFWAPAFKVRPRDFLRLSIRATLGQPAEKVEPRMPGHGAYPVTLPLNEAIESLKVNLASFMKPSGRLRPLLPDIGIEPAGVKLVYVPFHPEGDDLHYAPCRLSVNGKMLAYGRML